MATTTTMTVATNLTLSATRCCPQCGFDVGLPPLEDTQAALVEAQQQIADLQAQVRLLNQKASAAVDRWADYEDEVAKLRAELEATRSQQQQQHSLQSPTASTAPTVSTPGPTPSGSISSASPARSSFLSGGAASRLSSLLSPRKSTPNLKPQPQPPQHPRQAQPPLATHQGYGSYSHNNSMTNLSPSPFSPASAPLSPAAPSTEDLLEALTREQTLRLEAEGRLNATSREVEELSVSLFEQANEMVATERRARARLEERIELLEKRDADKRRRLDRLESAMDRIDRVRAILGQTGEGLVAEEHRL